MRRSVIRRSTVPALSAALVLAGLMAVPTWSATAAGPTEAPAWPSAATAPTVAPRPDTVITFFAALPRESSRIKAAARRISTPGSGRYRDFMTLAEAGRRLGATDAAISALVTTGERLGLRVRIDPTRLLARISAPVATWEEVMGVPVTFTPARRGWAGASLNPFATYAFKEAGSNLLLAAPPALAGVVAEFLPSTSVYVQAKDIPGPQPPQAQGQLTPRSIWGGDPEPWPVNTGTPLGPVCDDPGIANRLVMTPSQLRDVYGVTAMRSKGYRGVGARVALLSLTGGISMDDVRLAADCFDIRMPEVDLVLGTGVPKPFVSLTYEAALDIQVAMGTLVDARELRFVEVVNDFYAASYVDGFTRALAWPGGVPDAVSVSYYWCENFYGSQVQVGQQGASPLLYVLEDILAMSAVVGTSVFVASGDSGSAPCQVDGVPDYPAPTGAYPASSPWVTSSGGTRLVLGPRNSRVSETVWNDNIYGFPRASGGAYSDGFAAPWYQRNNVSPARRAFPDISATANTNPGHAVFYAGGLTSIGGTSAVAPFFAASVAQVSAYERARGRPGVGFMNPWLYSTSSRNFFDVVTGDNQMFVEVPPDGQDNTVACCAAGAGYDLATGLGVPRWGMLAKSLPPPD